MSESGTTTGTADPVDTALRRGMHADPLPDKALVRIRAATRAEWWSVVDGTQRGHHWRRHAIAAGIGMLLLAAGWMVHTRDPAIPSSASIGRLERIDYPGVIEQHRWSRDRSLSDGEELRTGQHILARGGGRIALVKAGSLRLAAGTSIRIDSDHLVQLTDGDIYVDIPPEFSAHVQLTIQTPAGTFSHLGTQFQLAVHRGQTQLRVREGQVRWHSGTLDVLSGPGTQLSIDQEGHAVRELASTTGADWAWAEMLGTPFDIEGRSLGDYLHYIARETGRTLQFSNSADERRAQTTILHGSIQRLTPVESLSAVMATTSLQFTLNQDSIRIEPSAGVAKEPQ